MNHLQLKKGKLYRFYDEFMVNRDTKVFIYCGTYKILNEELTVYDFIDGDKVSQFTSTMINMFMEPAVPQ